MTFDPSQFVVQHRVEFGGALSLWPRLKLAHAMATFGELDRRVSVWTARELIVTVPRMSRDGTQIEFLLEVREKPPLDEWSLIFADGVHALRSSLDALAWEIANLNNVPPRPNHVYFPIGLTGEAFNSRMAAMGNIHPQFVDRFRSLQESSVHIPVEGSGGLDPLVVLHQLDIDDKHRGSLRAAGVIGQANVQAVVDLDAGTELELQTADGVIPLESGYVVARMLLSKPSRGPLQESVPAAVAVGLIVRCSIDGEEYSLNGPQFVLSARIAVENAMSHLASGDQQPGMVFSGPMDTATFPAVPADLDLNGDG